MNKECTLCSSLNRILNKTTEALPMQVMNATIQTQALNRSRSSRLLKEEIPSPFGSHLRTCRAYRQY